MGALWFQEVAGQTNARLQQFFESKVAEARYTSPEAEHLIHAVASLTQRGGKRLRPCGVFAGYLAVHDGSHKRLEDAIERTLDVGASLELLQSYLLIQDDWMDGDVERRGGDAVHVALQRRQGDVHRGNALAMLAADLSCGFAWELLGDAPFPERRTREAMAVFGRMHFEVVCGQQLDLIEWPDVGLVHDLKSGSYTVRGPLHLGAILGDGTPAQIAALAGFGGPTGLAFQLRDDLLGTFGDPERTGKSNGNDLRAGKFTSLVAEARAQLSDQEYAPIAKVLGDRQASDADIAVAREQIVACGARERVENRIGELVARAQASLQSAPLRPEGLKLLEDLLERLVGRDN